jgi:hypothetical protein
MSKHIGEFEKVGGLEGFSGGMEGKPRRRLAGFPGVVRKESRHAPRFYGTQA